MARGQIRWRLRRRKIRRSRARHCWLSLPHEGGRWLFEPFTMPPVADEEKH